MNDNRQPETAKPGEAHGSEPSQPPVKSEDQLRELVERYRDQQKRMRCLGCGEAEEFF